MARSITSGFTTEITAAQLQPIFLVKAEFDSGALRFWSGYGSLTFNTETYTGSGNLLRISSVRETQLLEANSVNFELSGINDAILAIALAENFQGRPVSVWFGVLNTSNALVSNPYLMFRGIMDTMRISDSGTDSTISVRAESEIVDMKTTRARYYTAEDQKVAYPSDTGFDFVSQIQDIELTWGV